MSKQEATGNTGKKENLKWKWTEIKQQDYGYKINDNVKIETLTEVDDLLEVHHPKKVIMSKREATGNTGKNENLMWTEIMDNAFIQAMITQQDMGNKINGTFTSLAYSNMIDELTEKLELDLTKNHLKNRLKTLKEHFSQWYDMFNGTSLSGFSWNSNTQLIEAEDEVWDKLIDSKPDAVTLKTRKVSNYYEMLQLFARDRASGAHPPPSPPEHSSNAKKHKSQKRKLELDNEYEDFYSKLIKSIDNVANAMLEGNKIFNRVYHREYTGEEIYRELEPMGLEPDELPRALNILAANQARARTLFSCPPHIRMAVLKDMMGRGN